MDSLPPQSGPRVATRVMTNEGGGQAARWQSVRPQHDPNSAETVMVVESIPSAFRRMFAGGLGRSGCRFTAAESCENATRLSLRIPS